MKLTKSAVAIAAAIVFFVLPARAAFVVVDGPTTGPINTLPFNVFQAELLAEGFDTISYGATLSVDAPGTVTFYAFGSESEFHTAFEVGGVQVFNETDGHSKNLYGLQNLGSFAYAGAVDDLEFVITQAFGNPSALDGPIGSAQFSIFYDSAGPGDVVGFGFDDNGFPDDNHDDLIIFAKFTEGMVPAPASWGLMILGFAGLAFAVRRHKRKASA